MRVLKELQEGGRKNKEGGLAATNNMNHYTRPHRQYGIPLSPGTSNNDGSGALDCILEYRPTHIVHLAGTQADSLLNSNYHGSGSAASSSTSPRGKNNGGGSNTAGSSSSGSTGSSSLGTYSTKSPIFQNKGEEEEDILKESISSRPHLYDLRMGMVGMEQLLSGVVAQSMLPPRYGKEHYDGTFDTSFGIGLDDSSGGGEMRSSGGRGSSRGSLSEGDLMKMKRPHVVYASSYDALHFRDNVDITTQRSNSKMMMRHSKHSSDGRLNLHHNDDDDEVLGSGETHRPRKRPPHGLHGASRLIDEILSSSYHALHGISSIGLRFDAIYGPRGFGVPSSSIPLYSVDRVKRRRGVSPDVELGEVAVRGLWRKWMEVVRERAAAAAAEEDDEEEEEEEDKRRRLGEERQVNLIEEAGWSHLAHDKRDFVFVEGKYLARFYPFHTTFWGCHLIH